MKYIPADKLIAEIKRRKNDSGELAQEHKNSSLGNAAQTMANEDEEILSIIASLQQEQPKAVLTDNASFTKELKRYLSDTGNEKKRGGVILPIIKHFYELGINARKQEQPKVDLVAELKHHLATTPKEQLEKEWKEHVEVDPMFRCKKGD